MDFSRESRTGSRRLAAALVAVWVGAQATAVIHLGSVRHAICAEHGESIHAARVAEGAPPLEVAGGGFGKAPLAAGPSEEHAHCLVAGSRRDETASRAQTAGAVPAPPAPEGTLRHRWIPPPASIEVLRLAPKSSPPA